MATMDHPDLEAKLRRQRQEVLERARRDPEFREKLRRAKTKASSRPIYMAVYQEILKNEAEARIRHHLECPARGNGRDGCSCHAHDDVDEEAQDCEGED